jgi:hypothetical protein
MGKIAYLPVSDCLFRRTPAVFDPAQIHAGETAVPSVAIGGACVIDFESSAASPAEDRQSPRQCRRTSVRLLTLSLARAPATCWSAVRGLRKSASAIWWSLSPSADSPSTSISRGVRQRPLSVPAPDRSIALADARTAR